MSDGPIDIKLVTTTKRGRIKVPAKIQVVGGRIEFVKSPFALKDEIKAMKGAKWHGFEEKPRKIWSVTDCFRNHFQLQCMMGKNPYEWFDQPVKHRKYKRPLREHQKDLADFGLTYHYQIWAAEMGVGKTLAAIEVMEKSGKKDWWWVGPKKSLDASIKREFLKWNLDPLINVELMSYEMMTKRMKHWADGLAPPDGVIFDESSRLKSDHSQRCQAAQALSDGIRDEHGYGGYVILMSGTPSPKSPVDWWSQCLAADTWILTKGGPQQIKQLVNVPTEVRVQDQYYHTNGFYRTGSKTLYQLKTIEGYSVKATQDHKFFEADKGWCELKDLEPNDKIKLANLEDANWEGENTFNDGYLLGFLFGDGYLYYKSNFLQTTLSVYDSKKQLIPRLLKCLPNAYQPCGVEPVTICHNYISKLARKFQFTPKKHITSKFETQASSDCLRGFLCGFFDTDGSIDYNRLRITLSQVSQERILVVQRMLSYFGIRSKIQIHKRPNAKPSYIEGRKIKTSETMYILHITGDDAVKFKDRIGFLHPDKAATLDLRLKKRHRHVTTQYAVVQSITSLGVEETYDAEVEDAHCFAANGLLAHNCEVAWPGFLREGSPAAFEQRLAHMVLQDFATGSFMKRIGWKDDEYKCAVCGAYADAPQHDRATCASLKEFHEFVSGTNEVAYLEERLKGLVIIKHKKDCLDLPDKQYRTVMCEPNPTTMRVAKSLFDMAPNVITGLTLLRELSDGFQYREEVDGTRVCPVCEDGTTEVWVDPTDEEKVFQMIDMLDDEYVETLEKKTVTCPTCKGKQEIPRKVRVTREVPTPKQEALMGLLDENEEQGRIVIFAGFTGSLDRIIKCCHKAGWHTVRCDGSGWRVEDQDGNKIDSKTDPLDYWGDLEGNARVAFVAHPQSGGLSMTLTEARMAVFWSNDFNPESRSQAEDRIHRIGMDENKGATIVDLIHLPTDMNIREVLRDNRRLELLSMGEIQDALESQNE